MWWKQAVEKLAPVISYQPIQPEDIDKLVHHKISSLAEDFLEQIKPKNKFSVDESLQNLFQQNQFFLELFLLAFEEQFQRQMPQNLTIFTRDSNEALWFAAFQNQGCTESQQVELKTALGRFAYAMIANSKQALEEYPVYLTPEQLVMAQNAGILRLTDNRVQFTHHRLCNYYAAVHIEQNNLLSLLHLDKFSETGRSGTRWDKVLQIWVVLDNENIGSRLLQISELDPLLPIQMLRSRLDAPLPVRLELVTVAIRTLEYRDTYFDMFWYNPDRQDILKDAIRTEDAPHIAAFIGSDNAPLSQGALYALGQYLPNESFGLSRVLEHLLATDTSCLERGLAAEALAKYLISVLGFESTYEIRSMPLEVFNEALFQLIPQPFSPLSFVLILDMLPPWGWQINHCIKMLQWDDEEELNYIYVYRNPLAAYILMVCFSPPSVAVLLLDATRNVEYQENLNSLKALDPQSLADTKDVLFEPEKLVAIFQKSGQCLNW